MQDKMEASVCSKVCRTVFWSVVGILLIARSILGYSTGAQTDSCTSLNVVHVDVNGNPIPASTNTNPFTLRILSGDSVYHENRAVKVLIDVPAGTQFTGFVLQARETETSTPVGQWNSLLTDGTKTISCISESDTITHSSNIAVTSTLEFQWTPSRDYGQVEFLASIAQDYNVFWNNVRSEPLSFDSRPVFYVNQTEITLTEGGSFGYLGFCVNTPIAQVPVALSFIEDTAELADIVPVPTDLDLPLAPNFLCFPYGLIPVDDSEAENPEVMFLTIRSVGGDGPVIDDIAATVTITILDNDGGSAEIRVSESTLEVSEADREAVIEVCASVTLQDAVSIGFTVERLPDRTIAVTQDLTFASNVIIPAGQRCTSIRINIIQDNLVEDVELFLVTLRSSDPVRDIVRSTVILSLSDSPAVDISITNETLTLPEDSGSAQIQVCASIVVDEDVTVGFNVISLSSNDPASDDITFTSPLTILSGTMCNSININVVPDNLVEERETFLLTLTSAEPIGVLRQSSVVVTLVDAQGPIIVSSAISITPEISVREDAGQSSFQICASPPSPNDITIGIQIETVSSLAGGISADNMVTIPSGITCVQHEVVIQDDNIPESDAQYTVSITFVPLPNTIGDDFQLVITVQDDDGDINACNSFPCVNDGTCVAQDQTFICLCSYGFLGTTCSEEEIFLPVFILPSLLQVIEGDNDTLTICYSGVQNSTSISLSTNLETADEQDLAGGFPMGDFTVEVDGSQECSSLNVSAVDDNEFEGEETLLVTILSVSTVSTMRLDERQTTATVTILEKGPRCVIEMPCQNDGQCIDEDGGGFSCNCNTGWIGPTCGISDPCLPNPCQNSGACSTSLSGDAVNVTCMCTDAWTGANCESAVVCVDNPCQNGATCEAVQDGSDYQCTNCPSMYDGKDCNIFLPCSSNPCRNGGSCTNLGQIDFECACPSDFAGKDCTFDNPCLPNPCQNGDCESRDDGLSECICFPGFFGRLCETTETCLTNPCQNGGSCNPLGADPADFTCECSRGFMGLRCHLVDFCADRPCLNGGTCTNQFTTFTCACRSGFEGTNCNIELVPFNPGPCFSGPCANGGTCIESSNSFSCNCPRGWTGKTCRTRKNCTSDENPPCENGGTCWQTSSGVTCACPSNFTGLLCESAITVDQGDNSCDPNPCENGGSCFALEDGNFVCTCLNDLFVGAKCQNCACRNGGTCVNDRCECPPNTSGKSCEIFVPCIDFNCTNGGICAVQDDGMPFCICQDGFVGDTCTDQDFCVGVTCFNGGTCQQTDGGKCQCPTGFEGDFCSIQSLGQSGSQTTSPAVQGFVFYLLVFSSVTLLFT